MVCGRRFPLLLVCVIKYGLCQAPHFAYMSESKMATAAILKIWHICIAIASFVFTYDIHNYTYIQYLTSQISSLNLSNNMRDKKAIFVCKIFLIFKMAAAAILDFKKSTIVGAWHHPDLISRGFEDSKNCAYLKYMFLRGLKSKLPLFFWTKYTMHNDIDLA